MRLFNRIAAMLCCFSFFASVAANPAAVSAQSAAGSATISGSLVDQAGGVPVSGATVTLYQGSQAVTTATSDANGDYTFANLAAGVYTVVVRALGYGSIRSQDLVATSGGTTQFRAVLQRASSPSTDIQEIGRTSAATGRGNLSTSTTITQTLPSDLIQREGYNRIGDALGTLPGVNLSGLSSSIGDDLSVNIRGFGSSETSTLIDGHPIGPTGPGSGGFSYQDSPSYAIARTIVTVGSGALGLYGTDAIGGTVDMQTLEPTARPHALLQQGFGNFGKAFTNVQATGTFGNLGFAFDHAVQGTYGPYKPEERVQTGGLGTDFSDANVAANTYVTSGNYLLRNDLAKLRYNFDEKTALTFTYLSANSWDDKSGNGDNCFNTIPLQYYNGQQIIAGGPNTFPSSPSASSPALITCNGSIAVNLNSGPACVDANTYAKLSSGLIPGGPGPFQAHRLDDYHARLTRSFGNNLVTVDAFQNRFTTDYNRNIAGGLDPTGTFYTGGYNSNFTDTFGFLVSDDITMPNNELGFGYYVQHQKEFGTTSFYNATANAIQTNQNPVFSPGEYDFFVRDIYNEGKPVSVYLNAWLKRSEVTQHSYFDPRVSFVFRATPSDVIRLTGGSSTGVPDPSLLFGSANLNTTIQNITHVNIPPTLTSVGGVPNPALQPEQADDLELAFGHRFKGDSIIQADVYYSFERNKIFSGTLPITGYPLDAASQQIYAQFQSQYIKQFCLILQQNPCTVTAADIGVTTNFNASSARYQGVEITGRQRFTKNLYADYSYDIQSGVYLGVPDTVLMKNPTTINNFQINGLPLHTISGSLDYSTPGGLEIRVDNYYVGNNNPYGRPAFYYSNGFISQTLGRFATLNLGVLNIFNQASSIVTAYGISPNVATNQFNEADQGYAYQSGLGTTGLLPAEYTASLSIRF